MVCLIVDMVSEDLTDDLLALKKSKQIQTMQLLVQLLPRENYKLFECLLELLHQVVQEESNKMTADALGTLLAPCILVPRKVHIGMIYMHNKQFSTIILTTFNAKHLMIVYTTFNARHEKYREV